VLSRRKLFSSVPFGVSLRSRAHTFEFDGIIGMRPNSLELTTLPERNAWIRLTYLEGPWGLDFQRDKAISRELCPNLIHRENCRRILLYQ